MRKILVTFALFSFLISNASAGLIFQDDFGSGNNRGNLTGNFGNWSVVSGNVDLWNFSGAFAPGYSVDMSGNQVGSIQTQAMFSFSANTTYSLSFLLGNNQHTQDNGLIYGFRNSAGVLASGTISNLRSYLTSLSTFSSVVTLYFTPDSDLEASIFFTSTGSNDFGGAIIDNVKVVPEPSTLAILALGLIGLGARRFKK